MYGEPYKAAVGKNHVISRFCSRSNETRRPKTSFHATTLTTMYVNENMQMNVVLESNRLDSSRNGESFV